MTKNCAGDPEIKFVTKSILKPYGRAAAMPTALELNKDINYSPKLKALISKTLRLSEGLRITSFVDL